MFDVNNLKSRQTRFSLCALLIGLLLGASLASAQEAPRPEGSSPIKPPMIKPPMNRSQNKTGSVKSSSRRRKAVRRKRRARNTTTTIVNTVQGATPVPSAETPGQGVSGGGSAPSIKPPMANEVDAPLNVSQAPHAPISGGVLNGKAITLPRPAYPAIARSARASGTVTVQVIIDEEGNVISARAISGHPLLQQSAVAAAREAKFTPTRLEGQPVKVTGVITYNFVL